MIRKLREREEKKIENTIWYTQRLAENCVSTQSFRWYISVTRMNLSREKKSTQTNIVNTFACATWEYVHHTRSSHIYRHCLCLMIALLHELRKKKHDTANQLNFCFSTNFSIVFVGANQPSLIIIITVMSMPCFNSAMWNQFFLCC